MQKLIRSGNSQTAVRVSDIESLDTAVKSGASLAWLDSFSKDWSYLPEALRVLKNVGIKSCLVSPELQRVDDGLIEVNMLTRILKEMRLGVDAVCTKKPKFWENYEN